MKRSNPSQEKSYPHVFNKMSTSIHMIRHCFSLGVGLLLAISPRIHGGELHLDQLFPPDRLISLEINVTETNWDKLRFQRREFQSALGPDRQFAPPPSPYSYVEADITIDGVVFPKVGLRKKGFFGSQDTERPSLKIKLNLFDRGLSIDGLTSLTFNNNKQDRSLMSQFMGYAFFDAAGSPGSRCSYAKVTVNGKNLGIYSHVETARSQLLEREFGNTDGALYEGTVVDFFPNWEKSFELKVGDPDSGLKHLSNIINALNEADGNSLLGESATGKAWVPVHGRFDETWVSPDFDDSSWRDVANAVGYEHGEGYESYFSAKDDFEDEMHGKASSLYLRLPFQLDNLTSITPGKIVLRTRCDDGFIAYLNGQEIARHNAPENPNWLSNASNATDDRVNYAMSSFDLSNHIDKFKKGRNLLAVHALNRTVSSTDFLLQADLQTGDFNLEKGIWKWVDKKAFYTFWTIEGLLSFWDGYSGNRNNFFVYVNPATDKLHFMPWGADCLFEKHSPLGVDPASPRSVRTVGRLAHKLYQIPQVRKEYARRMKALMDELWNEETLLKETERIETMLRPHLSESQRKNVDFSAIRKFIRNRRADIEKEIQAEDMPIWNHPPSEPPVIGSNR
ncbi:CotH kinase family protein [Verrucomicrobia bacterium]|nr:CotH kinase family protein [Verrucomicrobiota bacterium]MDA7533078.1 CotH kinase family protein [Verrucomicrobiota bacterium]MDB4795109.1 CotH kinase family protein [Verrucomicrobiota bacterium]